MESTSTNDEKRNHSKYGERRHLSSPSRKSNCFTVGAYW